MISCLIFDLDGTLVDNREANAQAYLKAFSEVGTQIDVSNYHSLFGLRFSEMVAKLAPHLSSEEQHHVRQAKANYYRSYVKLITPNKRLISFLDSMHTHHKTALVTTASRINADFILDYFELRRYFDVFIFGEDVKASKPDPECYKICIKRCGVKPEDCLIFEDSSVGIQAAEASGAGVIQVFGNPQ